jgi:hypothetical protein
MFDYAAIALSRLTGQFESSVKLRSMLEAIVSSLAGLEQDIDALVLERWIDTAEGVQLDGCGYIVGEKRAGRNDDDYRQGIKFRVFANTSKGTPDDLIRGLKVLTDPSDSQYLESFPATALLWTDGFFVPKDAQKEIQTLAPAGIATVPVCLSFATAPLRCERGSPLGELFVNGDTSHMTANGADIILSLGSGAISGESSLGGTAPADMIIGEHLLELANGDILVVHSANNQKIFGNNFMTGVYQ